MRSKMLQVELLCLNSSTQSRQTVQKSGIASSRLHHEEIEDFRNQILLSAMLLELWHSCAIHVRLIVQCRGLSTTNAHWRQPGTRHGWLISWGMPQMLFIPFTCFHPLWLQIPSTFPEMSCAFQLIKEGPLKGFTSWKYVKYMRSLLFEEVKTKSVIHWEFAARKQWQVCSMEPGVGSHSSKYDDVGQVKDTCQCQEIQPCQTHSR